MYVIRIDLGDLTRLPQEIQDAAKDKLSEAVARLGAQVHAHIVEQVQAKLHSRREIYIDNLHFRPEDDYTCVVELDQKAMWIEEGMPEHEMIDDLLKSSKTKTAKDGSRYLAVPFQHNKAPNATPQAGQTLQDTIKNEMKRMKIPYGKIEKGADGKPLLGKLHEFSIDDKPAKIFEGAGQGWGPVGEVRQGPTGIPFLRKVRVYQREVQDPKTGQKMIKRQIMTFRVVSSKHKGTGRWVHPGLQPMHFFDEAYEWAMNEWQTKIKPEIEQEIYEAI